jgi:integrase
MAITKRTWRTPSGAAGEAWEVSYRDQNGKKRRKQFHLKKKADAFELKVRGEVRDGVHTPDSQSVTVERAAEIWIAACKVGRGGNDPVEQTTLSTYESHVRLHINPLIGSEMLSRLSTPRVATFRDQLLETRSRAMATRVLKDLKAIIGEAQSRGLVAQNVASPVKITKSKRHNKPVEIPSKTEIRLIMDAAHKRTKHPEKSIRRAWQRYHALFMTAAFTGMRISELRGLDWQHVNLSAGEINVKQRADNLGTIGSVKSAKGRRTILLADNLIRVLREWKMACPPGGLVFPNWQGHIEAYTNIRRRGWVPVCKFAELVDGNEKPLYTFHHLRHFRASILIASGATQKEVQVEMGHSSIQVTFDTYGHLFKEDDKQRRQRAAAIEAEILA